MYSLPILATLFTAALGATINSRDVASDAAHLKTLQTLAQNGDIKIVSTSSNAQVSKRDNVPFLSCDFGTATDCALASSGTVASCFFAAIEEGRDIKSDVTCAAAVTAEAANLPAACKTCLGQ